MTLSSSSLGRVAWIGADEGIDFECEIRFGAVEGGRRLTYASNPVLGSRWPERSDEYALGWQGKNRAELQGIEGMLEAQPARAQEPAGGPSS